MFEEFQDDVEENEKFELLEKIEEILEKDEVEATNSLELKLKPLKS